MCGERAISLHLSFNVSLKNPLPCTTLLVRCLGKQWCAVSGHVSKKRASSFSQTWVPCGLISDWDRTKKVRGHGAKKREIFSGRKSPKHGISLGVQWWRIRLPMQGAQVQSLVGELRSHMLQGNWALVPQLLSSHASTREPTCRKTAEPACSGAHMPQLEREKPAHHN